MQELMLTGGGTVDDSLRVATVTTVGLQTLTRATPASPTVTTVTPQYLTISPETQSMLTLVNLQYLVRKG